MNKEQADLFAKELNDLLVKHNVYISGDTEGDLSVSNCADWIVPVVTNQGEGTFKGKPSGYWTMTIRTARKGELK